jgi:hypothetical protein
MYRRRQRPVSGTRSPDCDVVRPRSRGDIHKKLSPQVYADQDPRIRYPPGPLVPLPRPHQSLVPSGPSRPGRVTLLPGRGRPPQKRAGGGADPHRIRWSLQSSARQRDFSMKAWARHRQFFYNRKTGTSARRLYPGNDDRNASTNYAVGSQLRGHIFSVGGVGRCGGVGGWAAGGACWMIVVLCWMFVTLGAFLLDTFAERNH